jgi:hypothetical protein
MQIDDFGSSTFVTGRDSTRNKQVSSAPATDVAFFSSMLDPLASNTATMAKDGIPSLLANTSNQLQDLQRRLGRTLKSSSKTMNVEKLREYPRDLSNAALTSQLLIKSLGKATQCIDKISNLQ